VRHTAHTVQMRNACKYSVEKPPRIRPFGRTTHSWKDSFKMDLNKTECEIVDWIELAQDTDQ
jgi:hypothetical protein